MKLQLSIYLHKYGDVTWMLSDVRKIYVIGKNICHHRDTEGTEAFSFFAHREMAMGKNNLPLRGKVIVFVPAEGGTDGFRLPSPALWNAKLIPLGSPGKRQKSYLCALCVSVVNK